MRALLDVNVLLALFDPIHIHHKRALEWFGRSWNFGWASCALTQNGFIRIIAQRSYRQPLTVGKAISVLSAQVELGGHAFWPDDFSMADPAIFDHSRILGPNQITDIYLLALAVKHGGRLATFDRAIPIAAVRGAEPRHLAVL